MTSNKRCAASPAQISKLSSPLGAKIAGRIGKRRQHLHKGIYLEDLLLVSLAQILTVPLVARSTT